jgi:hypothetical protein
MAKTALKSKSLDLDHVMRVIEINTGKKPTQEELCEKIGISSMSLNTWTKKVPKQVLVFEKLQKITGLGPDKLLIKI